MADDSQRTIPATPRRREAARREGLMPTAAALAWSAAAITAVALLPAWARTTLPAATEMLRRSLDPSRFANAWGDVLPVGLLLPSAGVMLAAAIAGIAVRAVCDGFTWQPARIAPRFARVDPLAGLARILSLRTALACVGGGIGLAALIIAAALSARRLAGEVVRAAPHGEPWRAALAAWWTLVGLAIAAVVVAAAHYGIARLRFERRIRMTPEEFADELKSLQADPKVRLLRQSHR